MSLINIFGKIFTTRFYAQNTGFFFLLFYLLFGVVQGGQLISYHYGLMLGIVSNTPFLLLALGIWILYNLKCIWYVLRTIEAKEFSFLYQTMGAIPPPRQRRCWWWIQGSIYAPVLIYVTLAIIVACYKGYYPAALILFLFNICMWAGAVWIYTYQVKRPGATFFYHRWQQWMDRHLHKPWPLFYLYELATNRTRSLLVLKGLSGIVLLAAFALMGERYDIRAVLVGLLVSCLLHTIVIFEHRHFEDRQLLFLRNLPVPRWKRYGVLGITYAGMLLPEAVLMIIHTLPRHPWHWILLIAFGISVLLLFRCVLYFPRLDQDKYLRWVFLLFCVLLFLVLGHAYGWALLFMQCLAFSLFVYRYDRYEPAYEQVQ